MPSPLTACSLQEREEKSLLLLEEVTRTHSLAGPPYREHYKYRVSARPPPLGGWRECRAIWRSFVSRLGTTSTASFNPSLTPSALLSS